MNTATKIVLLLLALLSFSSKVTTSSANAQDAKENPPTLESQEELAKTVIEETKLNQDLKKQLKNKGIYEGKSYYLKLPKNDLPGLYKFSISKVEASHIGAVYIYFSFGSDEVIESFADIKESEKYLKENFFTAIPKWGKKVLLNISSGKVSLGMTKEQATVSWGLPERVNRTAGKWGMHEQWIYGDTYLYFENGKLTSYQD